MVREEYCPKGVQQKRELVGLRRDGKPKYVTRRSDGGDGDATPSPCINLETVRNSRHTLGLPTTVGEQSLPSGLPRTCTEHEELTEEQQRRREVAQTAALEKVQQELQAREEAKRVVELGRVQ